VYSGKIYHFCGPACVEIFDENPKVWIAKIKEAKEGAHSQKEVAGRKNSSGSATSQKRGARAPLRLAK